MVTLAVLCDGYAVLLAVVVFERCRTVTLTTAAKLPAPEVELLIGKFETVAERNLSLYVFFGPGQDPILGGVGVVVVILVDVCTVVVVRLKLVR